DVGRDMEVGSNLNGAGVLNVGGALRLAGSDNFLGFGTIASVAPYRTTPEAPCACDRGTFFDVAGAVARARAQNDNAAVGLGTDLSVIGARSIRLNSGSDYFTDLDNIGFGRIVIGGVVALNVDGSLRNVGAEQIKQAPG